MADMTKHSRGLGRSGVPKSERDDLATRIRRLTDGRRRPDSLTMHGILHVICSEFDADVDSLLRDKSWKKQVEKTGIDLSRKIDSGEKPGAASLSILCATTGPRSLVLATCAGLLAGLDNLHWTRCSEVEFRVVSLPERVGGARLQWFGPPADWIEQQIPQSNQLVRGPQHFDVDLRSLLDLKWRVVRLDLLKVLPEALVLPDEIDQELKRRIEHRQDVVVALAAPCGGLNYAIHGDLDRCQARDGSPYLFGDICDECLADARDEIQTILRSCTELKADVLCFPELTLSPRLVRTLVTELERANGSLQPLLVVAGSFHVSPGKDTFNRSEVYSGWGELLWRHDKCARFPIPPQDAADMPPEMLTQIGIDRRGGYEDIALGREIVVVDTPFGRLATPICLDFISDRVTATFKAVGTNVLLIPAMTDSLGKFADSARNLGDHCRATSMVCNSEWLVHQLQAFAGLTSTAAQRLRSLVYLPMTPVKNPPAPRDRVFQPGLRVFTIREQMGLQKD